MQLTASVITGYDYKSHNMVSARGLCIVAVESREPSGFKRSTSLFSSVEMAFMVPNFNLLSVNFVILTV